MKITILNDNIASGICAAAHGLSWFIEGEKRILFDTGPSDMAMLNADKIGIKLQSAEYIVLSHGHWDHGNGLQHLETGKLLAHPEIHRNRYKKANGRSIGIDMPKEAMLQKFDITYSRTPVEIGKDTWFLGEIPRINEWDTGYKDFILENGEIDTVPDDTGMVINTTKGLVIISGCAHSGITNIVKHAMGIFPGHPVHAVMGGFHLKPGDKRIDRIIEFFTGLGTQYLYPSHCTAPEVICQMNHSLPVHFVKSGNVFNF